MFLWKNNLFPTTFFPPRILSNLIVLNIHIKKNFTDDYKRKSSEVKGLPGMIKYIT